MSSAAPPVPAPPHRRRRRALAVVLVLMALLAALIAGAAAWIWRTTDGLAFAVAAADRLLPARLQVRALSGSLAHGFAADELVYEDATVSVRITGLRAALDELHAGRSLAALRVGFSELLADRLTVRVRPPAAPAAAPQSIALPLRLRADRQASSSCTRATTARCRCGCARLPRASRPGRTAMRRPVRLPSDRLRRRCRPSSTPPLAVRRRLRSPVAARSPAASARSRCRQ